MKSGVSDIEVASRVKSYGARIAQTGDDGGTRVGAIGLQRLFNDRFISEVNKIEIAVGISSDPSQRLGSIGGNDGIGAVEIHG